MISLGQAHETELTLEQAGATRYFWTRLAQDLELAKAVVALVMKFIVIVVDYGHSLKDAIVDCDFDWVNSDITDEHFPAEEDEQGKKENKFRLFHFNRVIQDGDEAIREMDKEGCRPATVRELLAFARVNPEFQRQFPIIALKSVWVGRDGARMVAALFGPSGKRSLHLSYFDRRWRVSCRFLGVSK